MSDGQVRLNRDIILHTAQHSGPLSRGHPDVACVTLICLLQILGSLWPLNALRGDTSVACWFSHIVMVGDSRGVCRHTVVPSATAYSTYDFGMYTDICYVHMLLDTPFSCSVVWPDRQAGHYRFCLHDQNQLE